MANMQQFLNQSSKLDLLVLLGKIIVIVFASSYLLGNFVPFYEGNDSYTLATIAMKISNGEYVDTNELLQKTGNIEFIPGDWSLSLDGKHTFPLGPIGYHFFTGMFYSLGNNFALFYLGPLIGILFLIASERVATKLFNKNVGFLTLLFLATNHLFYRSASHLQVDVIFSLFFILGCYFLVTFLKTPSSAKIFISSSFFVLATLMRINGIIVFPIEIIIFSIFFILNKKSFSFYNSNKLHISQKTFSLILISMIIPWVVFFSFYFGYNEIFFDDPFTNYAVQQRGYENTDAKTESLLLIEGKHYENIKQYSKYLLPYQFPAIESSTFSQLDNILGAFWIGLVALGILFFSLGISFKQKQHRKTLIIFVLMILGTLWFFASVTSEDRAQQGVPGRYVMPAFTLFYMIIGFLLVSSFQKSLKFKNSKFLLGKTYRISLIVVLGIFFSGSIFFIPPTELIKTNSFEFKNPYEFVENHPPLLEGLDENSVILAIKTDRILEYNVIPFHMIPIERGGTEDSIILLKDVILDGYDVFIFKQPTTSLEKSMLSNLTEKHGFIFKDYSSSFCKVSLMDEQNLENSDSVCLKN